MLRYLSTLLAVVSFSANPALRAAAKPHAIPTSANGTWTNEDLERLRRIPNLISVIAQQADEPLPDAVAPTPRLVKKDPAWYAAQAALLNARLEAEQTDLRDFTQALDDARELRSTAAGIDLSRDDIGITPEATIATLQKRARETQSEINALEDLGRQNNMPPGILRD